MSERRYDEGELASILRAASLAQAEESGPSEESKGFTLDEIARLASEVGIEPRHIAIAAGELSPVRAPKRRFYFFGATTKDVLECRVDGEFSEEAWEDLVQDVRALCSSEGTVSSTGDTREWRSGSDLLFGRLSVTPRDGRTKVRLALDRTGGLFLSWAGGFFAGFMLSAFVVAYVKQSHAGFDRGVAGIAIVLAALYTFIRFSVSRSARRQQAQAEDLMSRVVVRTQQNPALQPTTKLDSIRTEPNNIRLDAGA